MTDTIATTITHLESERDRITAAIEALRALGGRASLTPAVHTDKSTGGGDRERDPVRKAAARPARSADPDDAGDGLAEQIVTLLGKKGALGTAALAKHLQVANITVRRRLAKLAADGRIHATGATSGQLWHLGKAGTRPPAKPAKEVP